ncbi:hypothetical protein [Ruminococcus sp.]|uniref:hypothetical protein n=1 Tax=Ruminococcus sp. TaxID=41978 RepID=UPI0025DF8CD6|nr:hypothetical protein [Ruminococcus sp.]MBR1432845.1 hypothetical protein [Ruminococcus sp.]
MLKNYKVKSLRERKTASLGKWILYITIVFFFIYDCYFLHFSLTSNLIITIFGFFIFFLTAFANKEKRIHDNTLFGIILVLLMFLYALSVQVINSTSDSSFLYNELTRNIVLPFFSSYLVAFLGTKMNLSLRDLCKIMVCVSVIQCVIIMLCFFNESFKEIIMSIQTIGERELNILNANIRSVGLGTRFDWGSFTMSNMMLICSYLYLTSSKSKKRFGYIAIWILQAFSGMLLARSIIIGIVISILLVILSSENIVKKLSFVLKLLITILSSIIIILNLFPDLFIKRSDTFDWMFQYMLHSSNNSGVDTLNTLSEKMYFLPNKLSTLLYGDGLFRDERGYPYMNTDPLIMRYILYWGIPGLLLFFLYIANIVDALKKYVDIYYADEFDNKTLKLFFSLSFILICVIYFKLNYHLIKVLYLYCWYFYFYEYTLLKPEQLSKQRKD